jgi:hypothetical protein
MHVLVDRVDYRIALNKYFTFMPPQYSFVYIIYGFYRYMSVEVCYRSELCNVLNPPPKWADVIALGIQ